jgi:hypothetical protein
MLFKHQYVRAWVDLIEKVIPETRRASFYSEFQTIKSRFFKESVESRHLYRSKLSSEDINVVGKYSDVEWIKLYTPYTPIHDS